MGGKGLKERFFCKNLCPDGYLPTYAIVFLNASCCKNTNFHNDLVQCVSISDNYLSFEDAKKHCKSINGVLPKEEHIQQLCRDGEKNNCPELLVHSKTEKLFYRGNWLRSGKIYGHEKNMERKDCSRTQEETIRTFVKDVSKIKGKDKDKNKALCISNIKAEDIRMIQDEVENLSNKCKNGQFYRGSDHWKRCDVAAGLEEDCCLTSDDFEITKCHPELCENPLDVFCEKEDVTV